MAKLLNNPNLHRCGLVALFLVFVHVQAIAHAHNHRSRRGSYAHETRLVLKQGPRGNPTSLGGRFQCQEATAGSRRVDAVSEATRFTPPHQERPHASIAHRVSVKSSRSSLRDQEIRALMSFRANVSSGDETTFRNWNANDSTPCAWTGVSCSRSQSKLHVAVLNLSSHQLVGNINSALLALNGLDFLQKLDLSYNNFTKSISGAALLNFSSLIYLNLSYNQVSGEMPNQVGELSELQLLDLAENSLSGQIPPSISNCTKLKILDLQSNLFVSRIPEVIGRLTHLQKLYLGTLYPLISNYLPPEKNKILGPVPPSLGNCSSLLVLDLAFNQHLGGQIPHELSQLQNLQKLSFLHCSLEGVLPLWISNLTNVAEIVLQDNQFHGPIPAELGKLRNLSFLGLGGNFLTGRISPDIANCTSLIWLDVAENMLNGDIPSSLQNCSVLQVLQLGRNPAMEPSLIPPWIGSLTQLQYIYLPDMNLHGEIPSELGRLSGLLDLTFYGNFLTNSIPLSLANCTSLRDLILPSNNLTGHLPPEIGLLVNLKTLDVGNNLLTGTIPNSITNLTQLSYFFLRSNALRGIPDGQWGLLSQLASINAFDNHFDGSIPSTLSNCTNLVAIYMAQNEITGEIPASFGNLSQLQIFSVSSNSISGKVPADLGSCYSLSILDLSANKLKGPLPPDLAGLSSLTKFYLSDNDFAGTMEDSFPKFTHLLELDLSYNRLSGVVPEEIIFGMKDLYYINLSHNLFSGSLSEGWSNLVGLEAVDVSVNNISGLLPNLTMLKGLRILDVSFNNFSGELAQPLASLPDLVFFNASYNNFVGPIPDNGTFKSNITAASFLGNPGLCGTILGPSRACQVNASESHSSGDCEGFRCAREYVPTTVAGVTCIIFVAAAVIVWWMRSTAANKSSERKEVFDIAENFIPNLPKIDAADILAVIREGEDVIGAGSRRVVYKASVQGYGVVAIKTFAGHGNKGMDTRASDTWRALLQREARIQGNLRHRNILKVLSLCSNTEFGALILEYMPQGSLDNHLHPNPPVPGGAISDESCDLPWKVRFGIAVDVAEGMTYLHHDCHSPLIHGDLKPSNVLLDKEMVAKVADFGISELVNLHGGLEPGQATVSNICGTVGYMPPEYAFATSLSTKGDVFSYGVLLLEMLSGKSPRNAPTDVRYRDWNLQAFHETPTEMLDSILQQEVEMEAEPQKSTKQMLLLAKIAFFCTRDSPQSRPSMKDVRSMLNQIRHLGAEAVTRKTVYQLLEAEDDNGESSYGVSAWEGDDPNSVALPSIST